MQLKTTLVKALQELQVSEDSNGNDDEGNQDPGSGDRFSRYLGGKLKGWLLGLKGKGRVSARVSVLSHLTEGGATHGDAKQGRCRFRRKQPSLALGLLI